MYISYVSVPRDLVRALQWRGKDGLSWVERLQLKTKCTLRILTSEMDQFAPGCDHLALISVIHSNQETSANGCDFVARQVSRLSCMRVERPLPQKAVGDLLGDGKKMLKHLRAKTGCYMYVSHGNPPKITLIEEDANKREAAEEEITEFLRKSLPDVEYPIFWGASRRRDRADRLPVGNHPYF